MPNRNVDKTYTFVLEYGTNQKLGILAAFDNLNRSEELEYLIRTEFERRKLTLQAKAK